MTTEEQAELARLRQENNDLKREFGRSDSNVLESLRTLPEDEALSLFRRVRGLNTDSDPLSVSSIQRFLSHC